jgi:hypothetical protein
MRFKRAVSPSPTNGLGDGWHAAAMSAAWDRLNLQDKQTAMAEQESAAFQNWPYALLNQAGADTREDPKTAISKPIYGDRFRPVQLAMVASVPVPVSR